MDGVKEPEGYVAEPEPLALDVQFSDGVGVEGEVVVAKGGEVALRVGGYVTRAGKEMPERVWGVREVRVVGGEVEVVVG
ncbi:hypothetical protein RM780_13675 [Streptomyces sp. DSM 44917]|uniref:BON domain-containing protein n=1 Tax=Streptomyces boetiae TaxID=3075541 RepID=A0ABU2L929_9ACTN|nr:hypothetical protein [Streptomyces sp. DSM 44917]MDT0308007.1 hypothetical protein [Streptomyces sp. DSM 44917]